MPELTLVGEEGWLWLGGSLVVAILWANLAWYFRHNRPGLIGEPIARLTTWRFAVPMFRFLHLLYYVGIPFAALLWGQDAIVGRLLGLQKLNLPLSGDQWASADAAANWLDWAQDVGWAATLGVGTCGLLALGRYARRRALMATGSVSGEGATVAAPPVSGWVLLREAAYHELHWAFYRNAPSLTTGVYWGTWIGLLLVVLEATLNPAWRKGLTDPHQAPTLLLRGALAVVSSALFLLTQNLWVMLATHWGISWSLTIVARMLPLSPTRDAKQILAR